MPSHPRFRILGTTTVALAVGLVIGAGVVLASGASVPSKAPSPVPSAVTPKSTNVAPRLSASSLAAARTS